MGEGIGGIVSEFTKSSGKIMLTYEVGDVTSKSNDLL
jgi:hypothetical protein